MAAIQNEGEYSHCLAYILLKSQRRIHQGVVSPKFLQQQFW